MDCRTASEHLVPWLEAELAPAVTEVVGEHVAHCPDCASLAERLRAQGERLAAIGPAIDPRLSGDAFWASMDDSLSDAWEQLGEERVAASARAATWTGRLQARARGELRVSPVGLAAYAAALLLALAWGWSNHEDARVAQAEVRALEQEVELSAGRVPVTGLRPASVEGAASTRVEAYRPVSHTPRRGTL